RWFFSKFLRASAANASLVWTYPGIRRHDQKRKGPPFLGRRPLGVAATSIYRKGSGPDREALRECHQKRCFSAPFSMVTFVQASWRFRAFSPSSLASLCFSPDSISSPKTQPSRLRGPSCNLAAKPHFGCRSPPRLKDKDLTWATALLPTGQSDS